MKCYLSQTFYFKWAFLRRMVSTVTIRFSSGAKVRSLSDRFKVHVSIFTCIVNIKKYFYMRIITYLSSQRVICHNGPKDPEVFMSFSIIHKLQMSSFELLLTWMSRLLIKWWLLQYFFIPLSCVNVFSNLSFAFKVCIWANYCQYLKDMSHYFKLF